MNHKLTDFVKPYPSRNDPDIQSLIYAKKEFRELVPDPNPDNGEYRVDPMFFNHQILFQRIMSEYGCVFLESGTGSGKSGCIAALEVYQRKHRAGEIKDFYYIAGKDQQNDFTNQITRTFGSIEEQARYAKGTKQERTQKRRMMKAHFKTLTYNEISREIETRATNDELLRDFGNSAFFFDEIQTIKLSEKLDLNKTRDRFKIYANIWRLTHVCKYAMVAIITATITTNNINESLYHANLLPRTKQFDTKLSRRVVEYLETLGYDIPAQDWSEIDTSIIDEIDPDYYDHLKGVECDGTPIGTDIEIPDYTARLNKLEIQREAVLRGRILYVRSPETGAREVFPDSDEDTCSHRFIRNLQMSKFQSEAYARTITETDHSKIKKNLVQTDDDAIERGKSALYQLPKQASVIVFPTQEHAIARIEEIKLGRMSKSEKSKYLQKTYRDPKYVPKISTIPGVVGKKGILDIVTIESKTVTRTANDYMTYSHYEKNVAQNRMGVKKQKTMVVAPWFAEYATYDELVHECSAKFWEIISYLEKPHIFNPTPGGPSNAGLTYVSEEFYITNCLALAAILESRPLPETSKWKGENVRWSAFNLARVEDWKYPDGQLRIKPAPRYIIYTSGADENVRAQSLELASHPKNVNGDYLMLIIATEVGTVGININNGAAMFFNTSRFTPGAMQQTKNRIFRATSHIEAIKQARLLRNEDFVNVEVRYMVARVHPEIQEAYQKTGLEVLEIDSLLYRVIYEKAFRFGILARMDCRIAVDAPINARRNIRALTDLPKSENTNYSDQVQYIPYKFNSQMPIDYTTYNIYYTEESIPRVEASLAEAFGIYNHYPINYILDTLAKTHKYSKQEIANAIRYLVETSKILLHDRSGYPQYLTESRGILYITRDPSAASEASMHYYSSNIIYSSQSILEKYAVDIIDISFEILTLGSNQLADPDVYKNWFAELDAYKKIKLFETAWILYIAGTKPPAWVRRIIDAAKHLYAKDSTDGTIVHEIELVYSKTTNYNAVDGLLRPSAHLRVYTDGIWRHTNDYERDYYAKVIEDKMNVKFETYYKKFQAIGILGIIVRPDLVHIREFQYNAKTDKFKSTEGTKCTGLKPYVLIGMIFDVEPEFQVPDPKTLASNISRIAMYFKVSKKSVEKLAVENPAKLAYYIARIEDREDESIRNKTELCAELCSKLLVVGAIFPIIGSAKITISKIL